jgi:RNA-directed DNA polymerase
VGEILGVLARVTREEGFTLHPQKVSVQRKSGRQEVTGIVVNERLSVNKGTLRRFRALLHQIRTSGPEGKHWGVSGASVLDAALGFANYVLMVDPAKGAALEAQVEALRGR